MKNMDIDYENDVVEYNEIDMAQSIGTQPLNKQKEVITNKVIRRRFIMTLATLFIIIVLLLVYSGITS